MSKHSKSDSNRSIWIIGGTILVIVLMIFLPGLFESKKSLDTVKHEYNLIEEGKTVTAREITEEFTKLLSVKNYDEANKYLSNDCKLIDSNNTERVKLEYCLEKLAVYNSYTIEKRGNDLKNQETYRILWNGTTYENTKQIITLNLRKKVNKQEITYEIIRVIFTDNTLAF